MSSVPPPPSLRDIDPELVASAIEKGVNLDVLAASVAEWNRRRAPSLEYLDGAQRHRRDADDAAVLDALLRSRLDDWESLQRSSDRAAELRQRAVRWSTIGSDDLKRPCGRPQSSFYRSPGKIVPGVRWCKLASCQRCGRREALEKILLLLDVVRAMDTVVVGNIESGQRRKYGDALRKYRNDSGLAVGGLWVPSTADVFVLHNAVERRGWGDRGDQRMRMDQALDLLLAAYDRRVRATKGNARFFLDWAEQRRAAVEERNERSAISRSSNQLEEKRTFVARGVLPEGVLAATADDVGLVSNGPAFVGDERSIDEFVSRFELVSQEELNLKRQMRRAFDADRSQPESSSTRDRSSYRAAEGCDERSSASSAAASQGDDALAFGALFDGSEFEVETEAPARDRSRETDAVLGRRPETRPMFPDHVRGCLQCERPLPDWKRGDALRCKITCRTAGARVRAREVQQSHDR